MPGKYSRVIRFGVVCCQLTFGILTHGYDLKLRLNLHHADVLVSKQFTLLFLSNSTVSLAF